MTTQGTATIHTRGVRWLLGSVSVGLAVLPFLAGCHHFALFKTKDRPAEKLDATSAEADPGAAAPRKYQIRVAPYVFLSDFEIPKDQPLFKELSELRDQVTKQLLLPPGTTQIQVNLFETRTRYERYMNTKYPSLPPRRAFFVDPSGKGEELLVYTWWSDRLRKDLRHELTHALLHSVIRDVPQWLDEGLAEYFELPPESRGVNQNHLDTLERGLSNGTYQCDLRRLERLKEVDDMTPAEYREAWAWVHFMLHSKPEARTALLSYIQQLRGARAPGMLAPKLAKVFPEPEKALAGHLAGLARQLARARAADNDALP